MTKEPKKKRFNIPEYDVDVEFARNVIEVLDCSSNKILNSKELGRKNSLKLENVERRTYNSFKARSDSGKKHLVNVDFLRQHDIFETGAGYILDICMKTPYHGFYFGLYEIGEFTINPKSFKIEIKEFYPMKFVRCGVIDIRELKTELQTKSKTTKKIIYLGLRESEGDSSKGPHSYYVIKLEWSSNRKEKNIIWKKSVPAAVMSLVIYENLLFIGLKNGNVQIWDVKPPKDGKDQVEEPILVFNQKVFKENKEMETLIKGGTKGTIFEKDFGTRSKYVLGKPEITRIEFLPISHRIVVLGGIREHRGDMIIFSTKGELLLNQHLGNSVLMGIAESAYGLYIVNSNGILYQFQRELPARISEKHIKKVHMKKEITSNIANVRDWICGSGPEYLAFLFSRDVQKKSYKFISDTLARIVVGHDYGALTGDDLGKLRFWKIGDIEVHEDELEFEEKETD
ncbi:MAG: hypothetical protein JW776_11955 [Candidatus Lokiarchaeota archaeon]|nr:hypothetical protein [Candidatus Lokiarchaeota archaeon]